MKKKTNEIIVSNGIAEVILTRGKKAMIDIEDIPKTLGRYTSQKEALKVYREAAEKYFGEFAKSSPVTKGEE